MNWDSCTKWKAPPRDWDALFVPTAVAQTNHLFTWVGENYPGPMAHDYLLYTDGSGCASGWGASAAIVSRIDLDTHAGCRQVADSRMRVSASYGSTVQRCEMTAMLDGLHEILQWQIEETSAGIADEPDDKRRAGLRRFVADDRVTVMWFTDRSNLAKALLFDEYDEPLNARNCDADLWMRFSSLARHMCITPMLVGRNSIEPQAACDAVCAEARTALKGVVENMKAITSKFYNPEKWNKAKPQKALF
jgi:hypothetical protein